jgi:hypothetical protein
MSELLIVNNLSNFLLPAKAMPLRVWYAATALVIHHSEWMLAYSFTDVSSPALLSFSNGLS